MKFNVVEAPSVQAGGEDEDSWGSGNNEQDENSFSSSSEEEVVLPNTKQSSKNAESSEDIMFTRNIEESYIQFGSSLAGVVSFGYPINSIGNL